MFYTEKRFMKLWVRICLLLAMAGFAGAVEKPYQTGLIVDVQKKFDTRILYYLVNTPVTQDDPYYEVSVQIGDAIYRGIHTPRGREDTLPEAWKSQAEVQVRISGHHLYAKRPSGSEMDFAIAKRMVAKAGFGDPIPKSKQ
jgi:hypothetical protein